MTEGKKDNIINSIPKPAGTDASASKTEHAVVQKNNSLLHDQKNNSMLHETERRNTSCLKWDALGQRFGDPDLIAMWVADMEFKAPRVVLDALCERVEHGAFGYHLIPASYHDAFISWEKERFGYEVKAEWILFAPGIVPALHWLVNCLTVPGDACLIQTPVYYPFHHAILNTGRTLVCSDLKNENGIYTIDFKRFEQDIISNDVKLFILCSPHNPVGRVWTVDEINQMWDICKRHHVFVLSDEIHQDLVFGPNRHLPTALIADDDALLITLTSASKTFNLAGLENAFVIIPDGELRKKFLRHVKSMYPGEGSILGYVAVEAAYRGGAPWLVELLDEIRGNEAFLRSEFARELPEVVISPLEGTYLLWCDLRALIPEEEQANFMQRECGIAVDYGIWFGESGRGFIRINLATPRWRVEEVVSRIIAAVYRKKE